MSHPKDKRVRLQDQDPGPPLVVASTVVGKRSSHILQGGITRQPQKSLHTPSIQHHIHRDLILDDRPQIPAFWLKHYRLASYITYGFIAAFSLFYLVFVGVHQSNPRMAIQFATVVQYLEYNSYSLLSPILCPVLMGLMASYVYKRVKLEEGDFFGLLGILLFFALVNFHDGYGIFHLITHDSDFDMATVQIIDPPEQDISSREEYHWQYAWSTRVSCAKKYVRDLVYQHDFDRKHVRRQAVVEIGNDNDVIGPRTHAEAAATLGIARQCNKFHDKLEAAKIREWMRQLQNEFKCCGPYGYLQWKKWFQDPISTGCDEAWIDTETGDIGNCYHPLVDWLDGIFISTVWIMMIQGSLYIVSMIFAILHHKAMKLDQATVIKSYSLMSLTDHHLGEENGRWWLTPRPPENPPVTDGETLEEYHTTRVTLEAVSKGDARSVKPSLKKMARLAKLLRASRKVVPAVPPQTVKKPARSKPNNALTSVVTVKPPDKKNPTK